MDIEREVLVQAATGVVSVVAFTGLVVVVGTQGASRTLTPDAARLLVGAMIVFVLLMAALGVGLSDHLTTD